MQLRESIVIAADASTVWPFVSDPALQQRWTRDKSSVHRQRSGPVVEGERFETVVVKHGEERRTQVSVKTCQPPHLVVLEHRMIWKGVEQCAQESYLLSTCPGGVRVEQKTDLSQCHIPWPWRLLVWLVSLFGRSAGKRMARLKQAVEGTNATTESSFPAMESKDRSTANALSPQQVDDNARLLVTSPRFYPKWKACVVLVLLGMVVSYFGIQDWIRDYNDLHWPTTKGIVRSARLRNSGRSSTAAIEYDYKVSGISYSSDRITFGALWGGVGKGALHIYPKGKEVTVFYDPKDPSVSTLITGFTDRTLTAMVFGIGFLLWGTLPILYFEIDRRDRRVDKV